MLGLSDADFEELMQAFDRKGLFVQEITIDDINYLLFKNEDGNIFTIPAGMYGPALGEIAGFALPENNLGPTQFETLRQQHLDNHRRDTAQEIEIPPYSANLAEAVVQSLKYDILQAELGLDAEYYQIFLQGLAMRGLEPSLELTSQGYMTVFLRGTNGAYQPIRDGIFDQAIGFIIPYTETRLSARPAVQKKIEKKARTLTREYQHIVGQKDIEVRILDPHQLALFIVETQRYLETSQEEQSHPILSSEDTNEFNREVVDYLKVHLKPLGLELRVARREMKQKQNEVIEQKMLKQSTRFPLTDYLIVKADKPDVHLDYLSFYGWGKLPSSEEFPGLQTEVAIYGNVCGIVVIPTTMSLSERKKLVRLASNELRRYYPTAPKPMILTVDSQLLQEWKRLGSPFPLEREIEANINQTDTRKLVDYGIYPPNINKNQRPEVELHLYEPGGHSHIGGTQLTLVVRRDKKLASAIALDRGWIFDLNPSWNNLGKGPTYTQGMTPFLKNGMFDMTRRIYRTDLLLNSLKQLNLEALVDQALFRPASGNFSSVDEFVTLEIYHRFQEDGLEAYLRKFHEVSVQNLKAGHRWRKFMEYLKNRHKALYSQKTIFDMAWLSHSHFDHNLGYALFRDDILRGFSGTTRAMALADHRLSSNWLAQDVAVRKMRELPLVGSAYPVFEYPYLLFEEGTEYELSPGIFIKSFYVPHILGAMGTLLTVKHGNEIIARVAYGGDYKDGSFFEKIGEEGGADILLVEATNPWSALAKKDSVKQSESTVMDRFNDAFLEANSKEELVVVDLVKNAFERLENIISVAKARGRSIILSPKILRRIQLIELVTQGRQKMPFIHPDDPDIFVWKPLKAKYSSEEQAMFATYQTISSHDLNESPEQYCRYVLIRENEAPEKLENLDTHVSWIYSGYGPYTETARDEQKARRDFARRMGWRFSDTGFHASGHVSLLPIEHPDAHEGILTKLPKAKASIILPLHTEHRREAADLIKPYVKDTKVIDRVDHPHYKIKIT